MALYVPETLSFKPLTSRDLVTGRAALTNGKNVLQPRERMFINAPLPWPKEDGALHLPLVLLFAQGECVQAEPEVMMLS